MNAQTRVVELPGLNQKRKFIIFYNDNPLMYCGKKEVPLAITVLQNNCIKEEVPLTAGEQGRILKLKRRADGEDGFHEK